MAKQNAKRTQSPRPVPRPPGSPGIILLRSGADTARSAVRTIRARAPGIVSDIAVKAAPAGVGAVGGLCSALVRTIWPDKWSGTVKTVATAGAAVALAAVAKLPPAFVAGASGGAAALWYQDVRGRRASDK